MRRLVPSSCDLQTLKDAGLQARAQAGAKIPGVFTYHCAGSIDFTAQHDKLPSSTLTAHGRNHQPGGGSRGIPSPSDRHGMQECLFAMDRIAARLGAQDIM
jgi:hypothetical protein